MSASELGSLAFHLVMSAAAVVAGRWLLDRVGGGSTARRAHGRFVLWGAVGGYVLGGLLSPLLAGTYTPVGVWACGGFGLLAGWLVGTLLGGVAVVRGRYNTDGGDRC